MADLEFTSAAPRDVSLPMPPRAAVGDVWLSVLPPPTTARPFLVSGGYNEVPVRIHNDGHESARGELQIELAGPHRVLASGRIPFEVGPQSLQTVVWRVTLQPDSELDGELAQLHVAGLVNDQALVPIDVPVRLVRSQGDRVCRQQLCRAAVSAQGGQVGLCRLDPFRQRVRLPVRLAQYARGSTADQRRR